MINKSKDGAEGLPQERHIERTPLVKNRGKREKQRDFSLNVAGLSLLLIMMIFVAAVRVYRGTLPALVEMAVLVCVPITVIVLMLFWPRWCGGIKIAFLVICAVAVAGYPDLSAVRYFCGPCGVCGALFTEG